MFIAKSAGGPLIGLVNIARTHVLITSHPSHISGFCQPPLCQQRDGVEEWGGVMPHLQLQISQRNIKNLRIYFVTYTIFKNGSISFGFAAVSTS